MPQIEIITDHRRHRPAGLTSLQVDGSTITAHAAAPTTASLVIRGRRPTRLARATGAAASLTLGWDGTLGYSLFRLDLTVAAVGPVRVELEITPPRTALLPTTPEQIARFRHEYLTRQSRFPDAPAEFGAWQRTTRRRLIDVLMAGWTPVRTSGQRRVTETHDLGDCVVERFEHRAWPDRAHHALLSIPRTLPASGKAPLLLAIHGHEAQWGGVDLKAFDEGHNDDFMGHFARRGWAVLQPATMDHQLQHEGWTLQGEWTRDIMASLDRALEHPAIDPARVAVCGLSTGGHLAMNMLALDERIRAGVVGCVLSTWHHAHTRICMPPGCDCGIMSQLEPHLEECDWLALAAPKSVQLQHGRKDACFCPDADAGELQFEWNNGILPQAEYDIVLDEVRRAWSAAGCAEAVTQHYHDGPHRVDAPAAQEFLTRWT